MWTEWYLVVPLNLGLPDRCPLSPLKPSFREGFVNSLNAILQYLRKHFSYSGNNNFFELNRSVGCNSWACPSVLPNYKSIRHDLTSSIHVPIRPFMEADDYIGGAKDSAKIPFGQSGFFVNLLYWWYLHNSIVTRFKSLWQRLMKLWMGISFSDCQEWVELQPLLQGQKNGLNQMWCVKFIRNLRKKIWLCGEIQCIGASPPARAEDKEFLYVEGLKKESGPLPRRALNIIALWAGMRAPPSWSVSMPKRRLAFCYAALELLPMGDMDSPVMSPMLYREHIKFRAGDGYLHNLLRKVLSLMEAGLFSSENNFWRKVILPGKSPGTTGRVGNGRHHQFGTDATITPDQDAKALEISTRSKIFWENIPDWWSWNRSFVNWENMVVYCLQAIQQSIELRTVGAWRRRS